MNYGVVTLLVLGLASAAAAQESAAFLKLGAGARALGMGGAYTAVADDASGPAWNPAGLSAMSRPEVAATHAALPNQTRYDFLGYAQPLGRGTLGAAASYLSQGSLDGRDASGRPTGGFSASDAAFSVSYAPRLAGPARIGGGFKYVRSAISDVSAQTFAVDLGGQYALGGWGPGRAHLGLAVLNIGPGMRFLDKSQPLPLTLAAGVAYRLPAGILAAFDAKHRPHGDGTELGVGAEYAMLGNFSLRTGFSRTAGPAAASLGAQASAFAGFAAGFGLKARSYSLDYSMTPFGDLGAAQRISLGARF